MRILLLCLLLATWPLLASARPVRLAWDFESARQPTTFVLQACVKQATGCPWREAQRLGFRKREAQAQVPDKGQRKCFRLLAVFPEGWSAPSNEYCP